MLCHAPLRTDLLAQGFHGWNERTNLLQDMSLLYAQVTRVTGQWVLLPSKKRPSATMSSLVCWRGAKGELTFWGVGGGIDLPLLTLALLDLFLKMMGNC